MAAAAVAAQFSSGANDWSGLDARPVSRLGTIKVSALALQMSSIARFDPSELGLRPKSPSDVHAPLDGQEYMVAAGQSIKYPKRRPPVASAPERR